MKRMIVIVLLLVASGWSRNVDGAQLDLDLRSNEPTIAVNPLNSNNIAVGNFDQGRQRLRISTDGGANFSSSSAPRCRLVKSSSQGDDSLAFDAQGRLFWSYLTGRPGQGC